MRRSLWIVCEKQHVRISVHGSPPCCTMSTVDRLQEGFYALKREAAPGVDGLTWEQYEVDLEDRLVDLHQRVHTGTYRAQPSRRGFIPKADGRLRPLGIAALEDKIVQQAVVRGAQRRSTR